MVLTGNNMGIAVKFGINTTLVVVKIENSLDFVLWNFTHFQCDSLGTSLSQISLLHMLLLLEGYGSCCARVFTMILEELIAGAIP